MNKKSQPERELTPIYNVKNSVLNSMVALHIAQVILHNVQWPSSDEMPHHALTGSVYAWRQ